MERKELYEKIRDAAFNMRRGMSNTAVHTPYVEQMKNVLYNNLENIEEALKYAVDAEKQIQVLELELSDAEREIDELNKQTTQKNRKASKPKDE